MASEMVERVARAIGDMIAFPDEPRLGVVYRGDTEIYISLREFLADTWLKDLAEPLFLNAARAAIAALREPSEAMTKAGNPYAGVASSSSYRTWQAMIDEALR